WFPYGDNLFENFVFGRQAPCVFDSSPPLFSHFVDHRRHTMEVIVSCHKLNDILVNDGVKEGDCLCLDTEGSEL
ncbi:MAG TPA: hypothetical protein VJ044_16250, partial [Candidatus Hodarchaeales archaeon]|nr:hypothetical protein [Candidatus Hodarchaeales archaeon]